MQQCHIQATVSALPASVSMQWHSWISLGNSHSLLSVSALIHGTRHFFDFFDFFDSCTAAHCKVVCLVCRGCSFHRIIPNFMAQVDNMTLSKAFALSRLAHINNIRL